MKIRQKTTWMNYLITGISVFFLLAFSQCNKKIETDSITGNYIYVNNTNQDVNLDIYDQFLSINQGKIVLNSFNIPIGDSIEFQMASQIPFPFYSEVKNSVTGDSVIIKKGTKCLVNTRNQDLGWLDGNGVFKFKDYDNYSKELISQDNFTLYYTFNDEDFVNAQECD